jgi:hypothetical protein
MPGFLLTILSFVTAYYIPVLLVYLAGGVIYAILKWVFKAYKLRTLVLALKDKTESVEYYDKTIPNSNGGMGRTARKDVVVPASAQRDALVRDMYGSGTYPPQVKNNKSRLFWWALFWPVNLVWTMLHDVAVETFTWLYNKFGNVLQRLSDKILPK